MFNFSKTIATGSIKAHALHHWFCMHMEFFLHNKLGLFQIHLVNLQKQFQLTYLIISHDLAVIEHVSDFIGVMYLGKVVELAKRDHIYDNPMHPYTRALLDSVPIADPNMIKDVGLEGEVPSRLNPPAGCRFHPRCNYRMKACDQIEPEFIDQGDQHFVACHLMNTEIARL